jgi:cytoskeletal protein CcmA (bactofilin family)
MFTRTSVEPIRLESRNTIANGAVFSSGDASAAIEKSVIGNDLKIMGQEVKIIGRGILQVDREIEGDVQGAEVIVGEKGTVIGMIVAQGVIVRGRVSGVVCGRTIALQASSHVEGDVHHMSLAIERGAMFEGRSRRATDEAQLNSVVAEHGSDCCSALNPPELSDNKS